jgi:hypothetical protein
VILSAESFVCGCELGKGMQCWCSTPNFAACIFFRRTNNAVLVAAVLIGNPIPTFVTIFGSALRMTTVKIAILSVILTSSIVYLSSLCG